MDREEAQARIDRIEAFRAELAELAGEGLALPDSVAGRIAAHHDALLRRLASDFDADTSPEQRQLSRGMRAASLLGALALSVAVFLAFLRFWGGLATPVQVGILVAVPLLVTVGVELAARRERTLYFAAIVAVVAFAAFVLDVAMLGRIFNLAVYPDAFLAWGLFAVLLAYAYGLRLMLIAGLTCLMGYLSATVGTWGGAYWVSFGQRPENFLLAGLAMAGIVLLGRNRARRFAREYRAYGTITIFTAILVLANWGRFSYLGLGASMIESLYQLLGFALAGLTVWLGIRRRWSELVNVGGAFFVLFLYTKLFDWWWDWLPAYLFFLLLGLIAIGLLLLLRRLRSTRPGVLA